MFDFCNTSSFSTQKMFSMQSGIQHTGIVKEELSLVQVDLFRWPCLSPRQPELGYIYSLLGVTYVEVCAVSLLSGNGLCLCYGPGFIVGCLTRTVETSQNGEADLNCPSLLLDFSRRA